ncbi:hypothetical protein Tco_0770458 [Tanacetum coccineum]|uniref:Uncharacterized protein n=1 Tax=Tanacetum coccineum TaxID=301880 RepID=A0ABQ4ZFU1_9ASTR
MSMTIQSSVKDKILATPSEMSKVENASAEMPRDLDQQIEKRADDAIQEFQDDKLARIYIDEDNSNEWNSGDDQTQDIEE